MKYLKIHTALWFIICLIMVIIQILIFGIASIFYILWCFKRPRWRDFKDDDDYWNYRKPDKSPLETFKRYFHFFDKL